MIHKKVVWLYRKPRKIKNIFAIFSIFLKIGNISVLLLWQSFRYGCFFKLLLILWLKILIFLKKTNVHYLITDAHTWPWMHTDVVFHKRMHKNSLKVILMILNLIQIHITKCEPQNVFNNSTNMISIGHLQKTFWKSKMFLKIS